MHYGNQTFIELTTNVVIIFKAVNWFVPKILKKNLALRAVGTPPKVSSMFGANQFTGFYSQELTRTIAVNRLKLSNIMRI